MYHVQVSVFHILFIIKCTERKKAKSRKDYVFWRQFNEKPRLTWAAYNVHCVSWVVRFMYCLLDVIGYIHLVNTMIVHIDLLLTVCSTLGLLHCTRCTYLHVLL